MHRTQNLEMSHVKPSLFTIGGDISDLNGLKFSMKNMFTHPLSMPTASSYVQTWSQE